MPVFVKEAVEKWKRSVRTVDRIDFFSVGPWMVVMIVELEDVMEACSQLTGRY